MNDVCTLKRIPVFVQTKQNHIAFDQTNNTHEVSAPSELQQSKRDKYRGEQKSLFPYADAIDTFQNVHQTYFVCGVALWKHCRLLAIAIQNSCTKIQAQAEQRMGKKMLWIRFILWFKFCFDSTCEAHGFYRRFLYRLAEHLTQTSHSRLFFIKKHFSPEWLFSINTKCQIDQKKFSAISTFVLHGQTFFHCRRFYQPPHQCWN